MFLRGQVESVEREIHYQEDRNAFTSPHWESPGTNPLVIVHMTM